MTLLFKGKNYFKIRIINLLLLLFLASFQSSRGKNNAAAKW
jgi:hypothetical protein